MKWYLLTLLTFFLLTVLLDKAFSLGLFRKPRRVVVYLALSFVIFFVWDLIDVYWRHWAFPASPDTLGIRVGPLPIEELFLYIVMALFAVALWHALDRLLQRCVE